MLVTDPALNISENDELNTSMNGTTNNQEVAATKSNEWVQDLY